MNWFCCVPHWSLLLFCDYQFLPSCFLTFALCSQVLLCWVKIYLWLLLLNLIFLLNLFFDVYYFFSVHTVYFFLILFLNFTILSGSALYWVCYNIVSVLCFGFWLRGMWDLTSLTRDWTGTPCIVRQSLNHWIAKEVPLFF